MIDDIAAIRTLIAAGYDSNTVSTDIMDTVALTIAAANGRAAACVELVKLGTDFTHVDKGGHTVRDVAKIERHKPCEIFLTACFRRLEGGADWRESSTSRARKQLVVNANVESEHEYHEHPQPENVILAIAAPDLLSQTPMHIQREHVDPMVAWRENVIEAHDISM